MGRHNRVTVHENAHSGNVPSNHREEFLRPGAIEGILGVVRLTGRRHRRKCLVWFCSLWEVVYEASAL
jgi:hypothetical protein